MHPMGIVRGQDFLPPGFQLCRGCTAVIGGRIECPAQMLARMTKPDAQSVMAADFVVERAHIAELLGEHPRGFSRSPVEAAADPARPPGPALRAPPDPDPLGAR